MLNQRFRWKNKQIREQVAVLDGLQSPTILLKNARVLHSILKKWMLANIWIYQDRIVYMGPELPANLDHCEVVDCTGLTVVPGYIEPHVHPFQLYNPQSFARYAAQTGTTTLINDNLAIFLQLNKKKAFTLLSRLNEELVSMYWWVRYDSQTELKKEEVIFTNGDVKSWLSHDFVVQGGELTGWPKLLAGDDLMLHWIQETKRIGKKVEGHFPGASERTLAKMMLFGVDSDHEAMTGEDVYNRLLQGYAVTLRHSSIRPDLPKLLKEIADLKIHDYSSMMLTTDGSTPAFYKNGVMDKLIKIALNQGVPVIDAYHMATYNIAKHFNMTHLHGMIATGRVANINILSSENEPTPISVLAKGQWVRKNGQEIIKDSPINWEDYGYHPLTLDWDLEESDLQFSMPFGMDMVNAVITRPYTVSIDVSTEQLPFHHPESFFVLLDRFGKWRMNTMIKGFAQDVGGFVSSYSSTGDIILIGKVKSDMRLAFNRMKEIGGGIVLAENGKIIQEIPLPIAGMMSENKIDDLISQVENMKASLVERGYPFADPFYTLLFLTATHLPYIRITPKGMYDVMNKTVLFPTLMR